MVSEVTRPRIILASWVEFESVDAEIFIASHTVNVSFALASMVPTFSYELVFVFFFFFF